MIEKDWKYPIDRKRKELLYEHQGGRCEICEDERPIEELVVDHDHGNGLVRGLLCSPCNSAIGLLRESFRILERAADYLDAYNLSQDALGGQIEGSPAFRTVRRDRASWGRLLRNADNN